MRKRLISLFLVLVMILTANTYVFAAISDDTPINLLKGLGILSASELEKSQDDLINRSDFTALLVKSTGMTEKLVSSSGIQYFYDVNVDDKNAGYIEHAYKLGITNGIGDGLFGAKLNVKLNEALAMCIRALRYDVIMKNPATPIDYMAFGAQMKLNADVPGSYDKELTYGDAYRILYNMMTTQHLKIYTTNDGDAIEKNEKNETYLTTIFGMQTIKGVVNSTPYAAKSSDEYTEKGYVEIGNTVFAVGETNAEELFGYRVTAYYRETEYEKVLIWVDESPTSSVKLSVHEVVDYKPLLLTYAVEGENKNREYKIASDAVTVVNGSVVSVTESFVLPTTGFVELFDDNDDRTYDIVKITDYDVVITGGVDINNKLILNSKESKNHIKLDDVEYYSITDVEENPVLLEELPANSLVCVEKNNDEQYINVIVINDMVTIRVKSIRNISERARLMVVTDDETGSQYYVSSLYNSISGNSSITSGGVYTFGLDIHGDIVSGVRASTTREFGYLKAYTGAKGFEKPKFRIFTDDGAFITVESANSVRFYDGLTAISKKAADISSAIDVAFANNMDISLPCIVRYSLNSNGELNCLELPGIINENNGFRNVGTAGESYAARYNTGSGTIGGFIIVDDNTKIFNIPADTDDEKAYSVSDKSELKNNQYLYNAVGYSGEANKNSAQVVVVPISTLNQTYSYVVFDHMEKQIDQESGELYDVIVGYEGGKENAFRISNDIDNFVVLNDAASSAKPHENDGMRQGNYLVLFKDADGMVVRAKILFDIDKKEVYRAYVDRETGSINKVASNWNSGLSVANRVDCGKIIGFSDGYMQMNNNGNLTFGEYFSVPDTTIVFVIDREDVSSDALRLGAISDIVADGNTGIFTRCSSGQTMEVIVVQNWGTETTGDSDAVPGQGGDADE